MAQLWCTIEDVEQLTRGCSRSSRGRNELGRFCSRCNSWDDVVVPSRLPPTACRLPPTIYSPAPTTMTTTTTASIQYILKGYMREPSEMYDLYICPLWRHFKLSSNRLSPFEPVGTGQSHGHWQFSSLVQRAFYSVSVVFAYFVWCMLIAQ